MKIRIRFFFTVAAVILFCSSSFAQANATSPVSATIIAPLTIANTAELNFGNVVVDAVAPGTVALSTGGARSVTGGVKLPATPGTISVAAFTVTGSDGFTYTVTLPTGPTAVTITNTNNNSQTMTVGTFVSNPTNTVGAGTLTGGTQELLVGATLNVAAGQAEGLYSNDAGLNVIVNYN